MNFEFETNPLDMFKKILSDFDPCPTGNEVVRLYFDGMSTLTFSCCINGRFVRAVCACKFMRECCVYLPINDVLSFQCPTGWAQGSFAYKSLHIEGIAYALDRGLSDRDVSWPGRPQMIDFNAIRQKELELSYMLKLVCSDSRDLNVLLEVVDDRIKLNVGDMTFAAPADNLPSGKYGFDCGGIRAFLNLRAGATIENIAGQLAICIAFYNCQMWWFAPKV